MSGQCAASQCTNGPLTLSHLNSSLSITTCLQLSSPPDRQAQSALFTFRTRLDLWLFKRIGLSPPPKASGCLAVCLMTPSQLQSNGYRPDCDSTPSRQEHRALRMSGTSPERPAYTSAQCIARCIAQERAIWKLPNRAARASKQLLSSKFSFFTQSLIPRHYNPCMILADSRSRLHPSLSLALLFQFLTPSLSASLITPSIHLRFGLPTRLLPSGLSKVIFLQGKLSCIRTICPAHLSLVILIVVTKSVSSYRRYSSSLYLNLHIAPSQIGP